MFLNIMQRACGPNSKSLSNINQAKLGLDDIFVPTGLARAVAYKVSFFSHNNIHGVIVTIG
jgi:hypothetical protein